LAARGGSVLEAEQGFDGVIDMAETAGLLAGAENLEGFVFQRG
jgi:hypothetical protein